MQVVNDEISECAKVCHDLSILGDRCYVQLGIPCRSQRVVVLAWLVP